MIVSASYRTDIPAFYGDWFLGRLAAGFAQVRSPYGGAPYRVSLRRDDVDGFVFWTKNLGPFLEPLDEVARRGFPLVVQYTITGYPRALESSVTDAERAVAHVRQVAGRFGPRAAVWRYDPIVLTSLTLADWHRATFTRLAASLEGATDEVVVSWATIYAKTARNLDAAARAHGFAWSDPPAEEKRTLLRELAGIAARHGMHLTLCAQPQLMAEGVAAARCVDPARLADVAGRPIKAKEKGNRRGCLCAESRDIGAYDTCPHGCVYCYAVQNRALARRRFKAHDPATAMLGAAVGDDVPATSGRDVEGTEPSPPRMRGSILS